MLYFLLFCLLIFLFIFGMTILRTGLFNLSANSLELWLAKLTDKAWKGLLVGTIITGILQSSSAVMVLTIGLISAGLFTFRQSIGIILGTNIGTTFTLEFITFDIDSILAPFAVIGTILILFQSKKIRSAGFIFLGIAAVFTAMRGFEFLAAPLTSIAFIKDSLTYLNDSALLSIGTGAFITSIIQSSTATTGIVMGFLNGEWLNLASGVAIMLGANIGTCVTALVACIGGGKESKLCAFAHIWLNIIGVAVFYPFIPMLADLGSHLAKDAAVQLAHISVIFNVISSILVLPFSRKFGDFVMKLHS